METKALVECGLYGWCARDSFMAETVSVSTILYVHPLASTDSLILSHSALTPSASPPSPRRGPQCPASPPLPSPPALSHA